MTVQKKPNKEPKEKAREERGQEDCILTRKLTNNS